MAGHRSLAPAVMVRIHPGQLLLVLRFTVRTLRPTSGVGRFSGRVSRLLAVACACGIPVGVSGAPVSAAAPPSTAAPGPFTLSAPASSAVLQRQSEQSSSLDSTADSTRIHSQAVGAQERFERVRRGLLPYVRDGGRRPCEERIGRLCIWHEGGNEWESIPDPAGLVEAREDLLFAMADAADHLPADEWILGQRIRYLGEAGRWEDAARLARACGGAVSSWCSVLEGFALHGMGRYEAALERFRSGLETMDSEEARRWRDPSVLLDGKGSDVLEDAAEVDDESEWENVRARVWTLADPLFLVAGNDRESEHYARWTFSKMSDGARNAWGMRWGDDLEEITVRYGWDRGWERVRPEYGVGGIASVIGHQLPNGRAFAPPGRVLALPSGTTPGSWVPEENRPRSTHVAAYAPTLLPGVAQVAVFPRGASMVVAASTALPPYPAVPKGVVTWSPSRDDVVAEGPIPWPLPALLDGPEQIGLFLVDEDGQMKGTSRSSRAGELHLEVPAGKYLLSVEAWAAEEGLGGRIRHGITTEALPDDLVTLSDLVLLSPGGALPQDLTSALPSMRSSAELEASGELVLGWEIFGLGWRQEDVAFELSFSKEGESFFGRIGRWLGFGGREEPLQIVWTESGPSERGPWFRSVEVTIPDVDPGEYFFRLGVTAPGREELVQTRAVEIVP